jgi:hypothetical protein
MSWVSEGDRECRYVPEHPENGSFTRLLARFEIALPREISVQDLIDWGWLVPALRVQIPASYLEGWDRFPEIGIEREIRFEDNWINELWYRSFAHFPEDPAAPWDAEWFVHLFDRETDPLGRQVRAHSLPVLSGSWRPEPVMILGGRKVQPWLDYFAEWQAIEVIDLVRAARLHAPLLNTPTALQAAKNVVRHFGTLRKWADGNIQLIQSRWNAARPVLDWVYQYRSLLGILAGRGGARERILTGAQELAARLGIGPDDLRDGLRNRLLVLWKNLEPVNLPPKAREQLRQDVYLATDFLFQVTGEKVNPYEAYWDPPDRLPREWERLREVIPFELDEARHEFPRLATPYIARFHALDPASMRFDGAHLRRLTDHWWPKSYAFRRFCLAFLRLHRHYGGAVNRGRRIALTAETPTDFLLLAVLAVEKLLAERFLAGKGPTSLISFKKLVLGRAGAVEQAWRLPGLSAEITGRWKKETELHDLTLSGRNPFGPARDTSLLAYLADTFLTFAKLRNYAAHHDALDDELIQTETGAIALEALLLVVFLTLDP